jgi:hypothetical protein
MKKNLFWMVGVTLLLGCPSDDGPSGETEDGTGSTGSTMSGATSPSTSTTASTSDSMSGTTEMTGSTSTGEETTTSTATDTDATTTMTGTDTDTDTDTDGTASGTAGLDCEGPATEEECTAVKGCEWFGNDQMGLCIDPDNPPCDQIPPFACEEVDGCVLEGRNCVPE